MRTQPLTLLFLSLLFTIYSCNEWNPDAPTDQELINAFHQNEEEFEQLAELLESMIIYEPITIRFLGHTPNSKIDTIRHLLNDLNLIKVDMLEIHSNCPRIELSKFDGKLGKQRLITSYVIKQNKCSPDTIINNNQELINVAKKIVKNDNHASLRKTINDKWDIYLRTE